MSLDCFRARVFPAKGRKLFRKGKEDLSCYPLLCGRNAERALQCFTFTSEQTPCHPFEMYYRVLHDGTLVLTVLFPPQFSGLWPPFLCLISVGLILRLLRVTFGPHRKIRIKTERNFRSHQVLFPAVEGNHIIWYLSNTYLVPSWNHLGFLPSLLLLRGCLSSHGYKPSSNFQLKYVQGSLGCV